MEIQPLFYSQLPVDCIYKIYDYIVYSRKLDEKLKKSIHMYRVLKHRIEGFNEYELWWEENELLWRLNDYKPANRGVSDKLLQEYPWMTVKYLQGLISGNIHKSIFKIWSLMSFEKQCDYCRNYPQLNYPQSHTIQ